MTSYILNYCIHLFHFIIVLIWLRLFLSCLSGNFAFLHEREYYCYIVCDDIHNLQKEYETITSNVCVSNNTCNGLLLMTCSLSFIFMRFCLMQTKENNKIQQLCIDILHTFLHFPHCVQKIIIA